MTHRKEDGRVGFGILLVGFLAFALVVYADTTSVALIVGNSIPTSSGTTFNNGTPITLTENTTTRVYATTTITDGNGCSTIYGVTAHFQRSHIATTSCDAGGEANNNYCYPNVTCAVVSATCSGGGDTTADYVCPVDFQYYADPTDAGSPFSADTWWVNIMAGDGVGTTSATTSQEINSLLSLNVTASIDYDTLSAGSDTGATNETTVVTNTGNRDMDPEISGTWLTSGGNNILSTYQEYSANTFTYNAGTDLSSTTPATLNITLPQGQSTTTPITDDVYWGVGVPGGTPNGSYTGTNTFTAVAGI